MGFASDSALRQTNSTQLEEETHSISHHIRSCRGTQLNEKQAFHTSRTRSDPVTSLPTHASKWIGALTIVIHDATIQFCILLSL